MSTVVELVAVWHRQPQELLELDTDDLSDPAWGGLVFQLLMTLTGPDATKIETRLVVLRALINRRPPDNLGRLLTVVRERFDVWEAGRESEEHAQIRDALDELVRGATERERDPEVERSAQDERQEQQQQQQPQVERKRPSPRRIPGDGARRHPSPRRPSGGAGYSGWERRDLASPDDVSPDELLEVRRSAPGRRPKRQPPAPYVEHRPPPRPGPPPDPTRPRRGRRSWLADVEQPHRGAPLTIGREYVVAFSVGTDADPHVASARFPESLLDGAPREGLELTVQVSSDDFAISSEPAATMLVHDVGRATTPARFRVVPQHAGPSTLTGAVHRDGNFVTLMHLTVPVRDSGVSDLTLVGRPPDGLANLEPRDISWTLWPDGPTSYVVIRSGGPVANPPVHLAIGPAALAQEVDVAQKSLLEVVKMIDDNGTEVFQTGVQIRPAYEQLALRTLANAGARLFREIFFIRGDKASQALGTSLREAGDDALSILKLQLVDYQAPVPWAMLYVGDVKKGAHLSWDKFLGFRHLIEQVPLVDTEAKLPKTVSSEPRLSIGLNVNPAVDPRLTDAVAEHQARWVAQAEQRGRLQITNRNSGSAVLDALASKKTADKIVYFYCHATSKGIDGDTGKAAITMQPGDRLTLDELERDAPREVQMAGHPLVFINACDSADLSPLFYTGFVPYFMNKGALGVIGTQCKTPAILAIKSAELFFDKLLAGVPVGMAMLEMRKTLLDRYRNPLGLLYAVHGDIDAEITPPITSAAPM